MDVISRLNLGIAEVGETGGNGWMGRLGGEWDGRVGNSEEIGGRDLLLAFSCKKHVGVISRASDGHLCFMLVRLDVYDFNVGNIIECIT